MILAAGLSPAWQQILQFDHYEPGEVNRAQAVHWCASGKVLNVAIALQQLGADCRALTVLGGLTGTAIEQQLAGLDLPLSAIRTKSETRVCTTILDAASGQTTELVESARAVSTEELADFESAFATQADAADLIVLTGSLPSGAPASLYAELIEGRGERCILDIRGPELMPALAHRPLLVKPNRQELAQTLGRPLGTDDSMRRALLELREAGATWVVMTDSKRPVWIAGPSGIARLHPVTVETVNPIGCGDCLAAGIAAGLVAGQEMLGAVRLGMAAAADNARQLLPARVDRSRMPTLMEQVVAQVD